MFLKIQLFAIAAFCLIGSAHAQELMYKKYTWESAPKIHELTAEEKEDNYIVLKDKILIDFVYQATNDLVMYETRHVIIHFNNEKGIEEMNKIYIPYTTVLEDIELKARTITHDGKVIPLSKSAIKKVDDLEEKGPFVIFAMEGVDKGGEIEYLYTYKKSYKTNNSVYLQTDKIRKDVSVDIYSPKNLIYEARGYNGFPEFQDDTLIKNRNHISSSIDKIKPLADEKYSATDANRMRFDYQLVYNTVNSKARLYTWEYSGNNIYNNLYTCSKQELKAIDKFIEKQGLSKLSSDEAKIRALEQNMKTSINLKELDEFIPIDKMLDLKYGNESSFQRLYINASKAMNIPVEAVVTTNRMDRKFDPSFQSLNGLQEYLVYFPTIGKYLCPNNLLSRLGYPPPVLQGNKGLFIKETEIGDIKTGITKVKSIDAVPMKNSYNNMTASVTFDPNTFTPTINLRMDFMGYSAYSFQPSLIFLDADKKKEFLNDISKIMGVETVVKSATMTGSESADILVKPLVITSVIETPHLIENAGNKYIFRIGEMLGTQEEMYKEKERQTDIELMFMQSYTRQFEVKAPAGYKFKNLDNINIDKHYMQNGKSMASFVSSYKVEGDVLKVNVYEDYQGLNFPKADFEAYRSVVNASADFNKVIIMLEKI